MDLKEELENADEGLQIGPLIDVVFLLLIYFIVNSSLRLPEGDLGIRLPGSMVPSDAVTMPDEQIIEINEAGVVNLNNEAHTDDRLEALFATLVRYKQASDAANNQAMITIQADNKTPHQRVIDVMDVAARAGIRHVSVGMGE